MTNIMKISNIHMGDKNAGKPIRFWRSFANSNVYSQGDNGLVKKRGANAPRKGCLNDLFRQPLNGFVFREMFF
ncbi:MAG: hypothetical protein A2Z14_07100 [Chloroflexi bacterium RBG_16_48_8]|nr:MAG: hypothetical protein A2Z14_07100 [Chloroflexi bacterium RBG_16_48_8]